MESWIKKLLPIIEEYKDGDTEALDGDSVDVLCNIIKAKINLQEGNITEKEYNIILDGGCLENEVKPTRLQKGWIKQANKYLYFDEDGSDQTVLNTIAKIRDYKDKNSTVDVALSDDDNVFVCVDFEFRFTCEDFLILIGYKYK
jgi:hypothetical protein